VIASFAGGQITVADFAAATGNKDPRTRARIAEPGGREAFLEQLVRYDLLALEAERRGYGRHPAVIEAGKAEAIEQLIERDLSVQPTAISAADVKQHYEANLAQYRRPVLRRASHIELETEQQARDLIRELKGATRERFAKLAGEHSRDERTRHQGGELGYFDRRGRLGGNGAEGAVPAELTTAAFSLARVGAVVAKPIRRPTGFSVLMLTGEMPAVEQKLADAEEGIRGALAEQRAREAEEALVAALRAQLKPQVHPELLEPIALEPAKPLDVPQGVPAAPPDPRAPARFVEPDGF
jgi:peptidyl-prolyl cis-trans isomerase C